MSDLILTPTERLVRFTNFSIAYQKSQEGVGAWVVPTVLSFFQWVNRLREEYLLTASEDLTPISDRLSLQIWRDVVDDAERHERRPPATPKDRRRKREDEVLDAHAN